MREGGDEEGDVGGDGAERGDVDVDCKLYSNEDPMKMRLHRCNVQY